MAQSLIALDVNLSLDVGALQRPQVTLNGVLRNHLADARNVFGGNPFGGLVGVNLLQCNAGLRCCGVVWRAVMWCGEM